MNIYKKNSIKIVLIAIIVLMLLTTTVYARRVGEFSRFRVTRWGNKTGYLLKEGSNGSPYVLNLYPCNDLSPIRIKNFIVNYYDSRRSQENLLKCGDRAEYSNWASQNYSYALKMYRENWWDGDIIITGSWSPDR